MKKFTVEPVPTPMTVPSRDVVEGRFGGAPLLSSWFIVGFIADATPETTVPAFAGTVVSFRARKYFFLAGAFFALAFVFAFALAFFFAAIVIVSMSG